VIDRDWEERFKHERLLLVYQLDEDDEELDAELGWSDCPEHLKREQFKAGPSLPLPWDEEGQ